jgi:hypothetical protein
MCKPCNASVVLQDGDRGKKIKNFSTSKQPALDHLQSTRAYAKRTLTHPSFDRKNTSQNPPILAMYCRLERNDLLGRHLP